MIPDLLNIRLRHFARRKDGASCRATARMWEKQLPRDGLSLYLAACFRAVTAGIIEGNDLSHDAGKRAEAEADKAMVWLKKAVAAGFRNVATLKQNRDLDALRQRADFKKLLAEVETGKANRK
jgi:hypothetical protein